METPLKPPLETPLENLLENEKSKILIFIEKSLYEGPTATIIVGPADKSTKYVVPQALLCHHSKFFDRALNGPFKESIEKHIELPEETIEEFELLLEWIYCRTVPWIPDPESIETIVKFYIIADKFDVAGPYEKVEVSLSTILASHWYRMCIENGTLAYRILESVYQLPTGHEAQRLFGKVCVRPYLVYEYLVKGPRCKIDTFTIRYQTPPLPPDSGWLDVKAAFDTIDGLAIDVAKELGDTMISGFSMDRYAMQCYQDPLTEKKMRPFLNRDVSDLYAYGSDPWKAYYTWEFP